MHTQWQPVSMGMVPGTWNGVQTSHNSNDDHVTDAGNLRIQLTPKGQAYLDRHFAEREGRDVTPVNVTEPERPVSSKPEYIAMMKPFEFSSLDEVGDAQWNEMFRRLTGHAARMIDDYNATSLIPEMTARRVIERIQSGQCRWDRVLQPNLLRFMFDLVRGIAKNKAKVTESDYPRRRRRKRGSGVVAQAIRSMDGNFVSMNVKDVIKHLPVIALLVGRLNGLLNPVSEAAGASEQQIVTGRVVE